MILSLKDYITSGKKHMSLLADWEALPEDMRDGYQKNAMKLIAKASMVCAAAGVAPAVSSGWRTPSLNKQVNGSAKSNHLVAKAIDIADPTGKLADWLDANRARWASAEIDIYIESLSVTRKGHWVHIQDKAPPSGNREFTP
jgi:hypothetical protein